MDDKIDVSVIIPAYNAEESIGNAVQSVKNQKGLVWELLIIENGSTDGTYKKCLSLAVNDNRIKVFQSLKGVSRARNLGIDKANGKWICFLDADDFLYNNAFETLKKTVEYSQSGLILFGHNSKKRTYSTKNIEEKVYSGDEYNIFRCKMIENPTYYMPVWGKFFLKEIIDLNQLYFQEELVLAEDADFTFRYTKYCHSITNVNAELYHYSLEDSSTVRTYKMGMAEKYMKSLVTTSLYCHDENKMIKNAFDKYILMHLLLILVHDTFSEDNPLAEKKKFQEMKRLCGISVFSKALKSIKIKECKNIRMLPIICLKMHFYMLTVIMIKLRIIQNRKRREKIIWKSKD